MGIRTITADLMNMRPHKKVITYIDAYEVLSRFIDYINKDYTAVANLKRAAEMRKISKKRTNIDYPYKR